jgi:hypothetical protein
VAQAVKQLEQSKQAVAAGISSLNTGGVPELEAYKKSFVGLQEKNPSLKGDDAIWFDGVWITDGKPSGNSPIKLSSLKKMKYLKTD